MLAFAKGHGTLNDFVCFSDAEGRLELSDEQLRFLCDRRAGIGGDGTLRAVRARHVPGYEGHGDAWFMDYRNADASIAEMCGNGLRVFLRYLEQEGLIDESPVDIVTRAGVRHGEFLPDGQICVTMGTPTIGPDPITVTVAGESFPARVVDVGNPHAAVVLEPGRLAGLDLSVEPGYPAEVYPNQANVEFVEFAGDDRVVMRVWERGVGETFSCGTGTVAAAVAAATASGHSGRRWRVDPPGGSLVVDLSGPEATLTGPAVIVARGTVNL
ncbi:diaminopimelate epimerase [Micropruina sonneratiae]|uniref:diaminopimelate epimerase n=1 Tax=Micropruina sonneratiae TaxID=2986940 RepID=UPI002225D5C0|nr:diaminopimelate epimerase [Micropruina sp. KQZ13P-5]MCW3157871.1 diaminopimelate epimerase [Micropruina sp. KQZ13P-5]